MTAVYKYMRRVNSRGEKKEVPYPSYIKNLGVRTNKQK